MKYYWWNNPKSRLAHTLFIALHLLFQGVVVKDAVDREVLK